MAKETSRFFDAVSGDRQYSAAEFAAYFGETGVFDAVGSNCLQVKPHTGLKVRVCAGEARVKGYGYWLETDEDGEFTTLSLMAPDFYPRIDRIVLRLDLSLSVRKVGLAVKKGTAANAPMPPELTREGNIYEISLAQILVRSGSISAADITDERQDETVCGLLYRNRQLLPFHDNTVNKMDEAFDPGMYYVVHPEGGTPTSGVEPYLVIVTSMYGDDGAGNYHNSFSQLWIDMISNRMFVRTTLGHKGKYGAFTPYPNIQLNNLSAEVKQAMAGDTPINPEIDDLSVTTIKLADEAVTSAKIRPGAVNADALADDAVTNGKIPHESITGEKLAPASIDWNKIADNAIKRKHITDGIIDTDKLDTWAVTETKIANGSITTPKLGDCVLSTGNIEDGAITPAKLADGVLPANPVTAPEDLPDGKVLLGGGGKTAAAGDYTVEAVVPSEGYVRFAFTQSDGIRLALDTGKPMTTPCTLSLEARWVSGYEGVEVGPMLPNASIYHWDTGSYLSLTADWSAATLTNITDLSAVNLFVYASAAAELDIRGIKLINADGEDILDHAAFEALGAYHPGIEDTPENHMLPTLQKTQARIDAATAPLATDIANRYTHLASDSRYSNALVGCASGSNIRVDDACNGSPLRKATVTGVSIAGAVPATVTINDTIYPLTDIAPLLSKDGVSDSYDLVTGTETRRWHKYMMPANGSYGQMDNANSSTTFGVQLTAGNTGNPTCINAAASVCDTLSYGYAWGGDTPDVFAVSPNGTIQIRLAKSRLTPYGFADDMTANSKIACVKSWLRDNPTTVWYQMGNPVVTNRDGREIRVPNPFTATVDVGDLSLEYIQDANNRLSQAEAQIDSIRNVLADTVVICGVQFGGSANSGATVKRLYAAAGKTAGVGTDTQTAVNDFDSIYPWCARRRCCGYYDSAGNFVINAYDGEPGYTTDGSGGEVWVEHALFYFSDIDDGVTKTTIIANVPIPDLAPDPAPIFLRPDHTLRQKAYTAAYPMATVDGKATSRAGVLADVYSLNTAMTAARTLGDDYTVTTTAEWYTECLYMWVEFATRNLQSVMMGASIMPHNASHTAKTAETGTNRIIVDADVAAKFTVGQTIGIGTALGNTEIANNRIVTAISVYDEDRASIIFDGKPVDIAVGNVVWSSAWINGSCDGVLSSSGSPVSNTDGQHNCVYRGRETPYGNAFEWISDVLFDRKGSGTADDPYTYDIYHLPDPTKYAAGAITDDYVRLNYQLPTADGYVKTLGYDGRYPHMRLPCQAGASTTTYYGDYYSYPRGAICTARVGGNWSGGAYVGPCYFSCASTPMASGAGNFARLSHF